MLLMLILILTLSSLDADTDTDADADAGARDAEENGVLRDTVPVDQAAREGASYMGNSSVQG